MAPAARVVVVAAAPEAALAPPLDTTWRDTLWPSSTRTSKRWSTSAEVDSSSYRVSLSRGKLDMGLGFDNPTHPTMATSTVVRSTDPTRPIVPTVPSLSVGLRSTSAGAPASSLIERATEGAAPPASTRRVGLEWKPVQSRVFVRGGLGLRLSGDDQVTMKLKSGRVGIYMKSTF
jgi:hypothetical protein